MIKKLLGLMFIASIAFSQGTLPNTGLHTWARGVNPGAGSLTTNSDSLNGNFFKLDSLWGVGHLGGEHFNPSVIGIMRFVDDSTIKIRYRNDDTILTKSTGQYALITQVRDRGAREAATLNGLLVRTSDDDSTLAGITAYGNGVTQLFGFVQVSDSITLNNSGVLMFENQSNGAYFKFSHRPADSTLVFKSENDSVMTFFGGTVGRYIKIDPQTTLKGGAKFRGQNSFTDTATSDTVVIPGATASDIYFLQAYTSTHNELPIDGDLLNWSAKTDTLIVNRQTGATSGLKYSYIRLQ